MKNHSNIYGAMFDIVKTNRILAWLLGSVATLFCVTVAIYAYSWGISKQVEYEWTAGESARKYSNYTYGPERRACLGEPLQDQPYCIAQADDKKRDYQRNEDDLVAQKTTAIWTFLMGCAAIAGVALSALGVFLVWTTFSETKRANSIAIANAKIQLRAYVFVDNIVVKYDDSIVKKICGQVCIKNAGQTPAINVKSYIAWAGETGDFVENWVEYEFQDGDSKGVIGNGGTIFANFDTSKSADINKSLTEYQVAEVSINRRNFWVYGKVSYDDIFDFQHHMTFRFKLGGDQWNPRFNICSEGNTAT